MLLALEAYFLSMIFLPGSSWLWSSVRRRAPTLVPWYAMCHFFSALETSQWGLILHKEDAFTFRHTYFTMRRPCRC